MVGKWRKAPPVKIVRQVTGAAMHGPELMPHRRTLGRVLVDDQMVDQPGTDPLAPVQRGVPEWRSEHVAANDADANAPIRQSPSFQFVAKPSQQHRDVLALQIPPGLKIEFVTQDVDAVPGTKVRTHGFIETELITIVGRP